MNKMTIDLDAYFRRIGYDGSRDPTLETLGAINLLHTQEIAFENLNPLMKWPVDLDTASLQRKLVTDGRGGYCFEHGLLLSDVLKALGFKVKGLLARVIRDTPADVLRPRTHMLLHIELDGDVYLADVGFGLAAMTSPIRLAPDIAQPTPHEPYRLTGTAAGFVMQVKYGADWHELYRFDLQEQFRPDYDVANWYTSTHPDSRFVKNLMMSRADDGCRHTLRDNVYTLRPLGAPAQRRTLTSVQDLRAVIEGEFRIALPDSPDLDQVLSRIVSK